MTNKFEIEVKAEARAALKKLPPDVCREIGDRLHLLQQDFSGDVKKLKGSQNEYRLRVGDYRVLFELVGRRIVVYTVGHGKTFTDEYCCRQIKRPSGSVA